MHICCEAVTERFTLRVAVIVLCVLGSTNVDIIGAAESSCSKLTGRTTREGDHPDGFESHIPKKKDQLEVMSHLDRKLGEQRSFPAS